MNRSKSTSTLVLLAFDERDAIDWRFANIELADAVRVVPVRDAVEDFRGRDVTAVIYTDRATEHHNFAKAITCARYVVAKAAPTRGFVKRADEFVDADLRSYLSSFRENVAALAARTAVPDSTYSPDAEVYTPRHRSR